MKLIWDDSVMMKEWIGIVADPIGLLVQWLAQAQGFGASQTFQDGV